MRFPSQSTEADFRLVVLADGLVRILPVVTIEKGHRLSESVSRAIFASAYCAGEREANPDENQRHAPPSNDVENGRHEYVTRSCSLTALPSRAGRRGRPVPGC